MRQMAREELEAGVNLAHCLRGRPQLLGVPLSLVTLGTLLDVSKLDVK